MAEHGQSGHLTLDQVEAVPMYRWNSKLISEILAQKKKEKSEDRDNLLRLVSRSLYGEAIHYALELIQNAEDEESSHIKFQFDKDCVGCNKRRQGF
jgi:hypothetical protein